jgi:glycosyltransferase involved in cell wall biosynthesis
LKILQINNFHSRVGGAEVVYLNTIALLKEQNHEVVSFSTKSDDVSQSDYYINYSKSFKSRFYSIDAVKIIKKIIEIEKPQIAHIHNIIGGITYSILPVLKKNKIPVVASIHDYKLLCPACNLYNSRIGLCEKCIRGKYYNCILNNCSLNGINNSVLLAGESYLRDSIYPFIKYIDRFIFVSNFEKNKFINAYPNLAIRSDHSYNFTDHFEQHKFRGEYFISFGRLSIEKGLLTMIEAFKKTPEAKLKIIGEGPLKSKLEKIKPPNVELLGFKNGIELTNLVKNASFTVIASECYETNSLTTVESFAMGKPVIGPDQGVFTELISENSTGLIFRSGDPLSLSEKIKKCLQMRSDEYINLSDKAFIFAKENFSQTTHYNKLIDIYNTALGKQ